MIVKIYIQFLKILRKIWIPLIYIVLPILLFWRNFDFSGINLTFFNGDFNGYYFPDFLQSSKILKDIFNGKLISEIFWDPYNLIGFPLFGAVDRVGILYPVRLIFHLVSNLFPDSWQVFFATYYSLFHMSLAAMGAYLFSKRCLGLKTFFAFVTGLLYGMSGTFLYLATYLNIVPGPALLPFILYFLFTGIQKNSYPRAIVSGYLLSLIIVSGYTATFFYNNLFILLFLLFYFVRSMPSFLKVFAFLVVANGIALLFSAVILFPSREIQQMAERQSLNLVGSSSTGTSLASMLNYFLPNFYGLEKNGTVFGYIGVASFSFILLTIRQTRNRVIPFFIFSALLFVVLSMGNATFLHSLFYRFFPFYSYFRYLTLHHYFVTFSLAILVGFGLSYYDEHEESRGIWIRYLSIMLLSIGGLVLVLSIIQFLSSNPDINAVFSEMIHSTFHAFLVLTLIFLIFKFASRKYLHILIVTVIVLDIFSIASKDTLTNSKLDPRRFNSEGSIISKVKQLLGSDLSRVFLHDSSLRYNSAAEKIYQIDGFQGLPTRMYTAVVNHYQNNEYWIPADSPLLDMWSVRYIVTSRTLLPAEKKHFKTAFVGKVNKNNFGRYYTRSGVRLPIGTIIYVYENTDRLPRAYLVNNLVKTADEKKALELLDRIDIRNSAVVTTNKNILPLSADINGSIAKIKTYKNSYVDIDVLSNGNSFLVLTDAFFPGWKAYVDGKTSDIYKTNVALRGVFLEDGRHQVEFKYEPKRLYLGAIISFVTFILVLVFFIFQYRRRSPITFS